MNYAAYKVIFNLGMENADKSFVNVCKLSRSHSLQEHTLSAWSGTYCIGLQVLVVLIWTSTSTYVTKGK